MDSDFSKRYDWFYRTYFQDEAIPKQKKDTSVTLPSPLRAARSLEDSIPRGWQSQEALFIKQGKLLADYEDEYEHSEQVTHYYPTYQRLSNRELRGYFGWRTKLRRGCVEETSATYAFLYIYELLNLITVDTPEKGFDKLVEFRQTYGQLDDSIIPYLDRWLVDFAVLHNLDSALLQDLPQMELDQILDVLTDPHSHTPEQIMETVHTFAHKWLKRSRFYSDHKQDMDQVIPQVIRGIADHYNRGKRGFVDQLFGPMQEYPLRLLDTAVYYRANPPQHEQYVLSPYCIYQRHGHFWTIKRRYVSRECPKLVEYIKTIDTQMRLCYDYGYPLKSASKLQWLNKLIQTLTLEHIEQQKQPEVPKLQIDYSQLDNIRRNAEVTREALLVEEERMDDPIPPAPEPEDTPIPDTPLEPEEYRLLQCLLYGGTLQWVRASGLMVSVLVDGINDKLYDTFLDTVVEADPPGVIEDYISDLKEMVQP